MNESELEFQVAEAFRGEGYKLRRTSGRDIGADFYVETPDGKRFAIEVKTRRVGVPDVLSVASASSRASLGKYYSPVIVASGEVLPFAEEAAKKNGVLVVWSEGRDIAPRMRFVESYTALMDQLAKFLRVGTRDPALVMDRAASSSLLSREEIESLQILRDARNRVAHAKEVPQNEFEMATALCKALVAKLAEHK
jgi:predicted RecB family endonuclease